MSAPNFSYTDATSATLASLSFGSVAAGSTSAATTFLIWNNKGGGSAVSDATSCQLTTMTWTGLTTGDTVQNGQEVVSYTTMKIQCISQGDSGYTAIGGTTTAPVGSALGGVGTIKGLSNGDYAVVQATQSPPTNVTAGTAQFLIRIQYVYT